jgi:hypothetical protein
MFDPHINSAKSDLFRTMKVHAITETAHTHMRKLRDSITINHLNIAADSAGRIPFGRRAVTGLRLRRR